MIRIRIPGALPKPTADLRIIYHIGTLGLKYSEILHKSRWRPGAVIWAPPDTVRAEFELIGKINSTVSSNLAGILAPLENFEQNSKNTQKNARKRK